MGKKALTTGSEERLHDQAVELELLMPLVLQRMFTLDPEHSLAELTQAQRRLCRILSQIGPRTLSEVCEELGVSHAAATQIADRLERVEMVERVPCAKDRRIKYLQLSPRGKQLMQTWHNRRIRRAEQTLAQLSEEQRRAVLATFDLLLEAAVTITPAPPSEVQETTALRELLP